MAIINSITIGKGRGSLGNVTLAMRGGETTARQKIMKGTGGGVVRSYRQMARRVRWANLIRVWQSFNNDLHPSFEARTGLVSDFNLFMRANINNAPVYLTSQQADAGASVISAIVISNGSLPSIDVAAGTGGGFVSDISVGNFAMDEETTIGELSTAILNNNTDFIEGDMITVFVAKQTRNAATGIPYVNITAQRLRLVTGGDDAEVPVSDVLDPEGFSIVDGKIGVGATIDGGVAWVHSREDGSGYKVSRQMMTVSNSLLAEFQSDAAMNNAIVSYGGKLTGEFLRPSSFAAEQTA